MPNPPGTYFAEVQAKRHAEVMDALHTIGRNIAQQESRRGQTVSAIDRVANAMTRGVFPRLCVVRDLAD